VRRSVSDYERDIGAAGNGAGKERFITARAQSNINSNTGKGSRHGYQYAPRMARCNAVFPSRDVRRV
jgi:hypothetical protein